MECPHCNEARPLFIWADRVAWGCNTCGYSESEYHGPSFPGDDLGIRSVQRDLTNLSASLKQDPQISRSSFFH
jgi:hypothetical protein